MKKEEDKTKTGRPKKFDSPEEMNAVIESYFEKCDNRVKNVYDKRTESVVELNCPIPYTIEGLCNALEISRQTLLNYENDESNKAFFDTIKKAKNKVQQNHVERGLEGDSVPSVSIFVMKNNFGYKDKIEQEITGKDGDPIKTESTSQHRVIFENYNNNE